MMFPKSIVPRPRKQIANPLLPVLPDRPACFAWKPTSPAMHKSIAGFSSTVRQPRSERPNTSRVPSAVESARIHEAVHIAPPSIAAKPVHRISGDGVILVDVKVTHL